ncbi:general secretion pathway protein GspL [Parasphingopyxis sp. CP4]|uniref:type II secretion system protein GspL n=1 Tax=Parasphingopyxis sp. CP4 TaxID=2724527 RepID=UPI0015A29987|nr:type II secretion system protein GspL [Parasphingopyxis sp. CP4]QLC21289.1 general secretion pathway protein GspL [Parasphingopyxis sp. CP4]
MSGNYLVVFLGAQSGWMRLVDGRSVVRQSGLESLPTSDEQGDEAETSVLVVPGTDVATHWTKIPGGLTTAQERAAARIAAEELSAEPLSRQHLAVGSAEGDERCIGLASRANMDAWLAQAADYGFDPDLVVPEPFLLCPPDDGARILSNGDDSIVRGANRAFVAEANIAALLLGDTPLENITSEQFEGEIGEALEKLPLNLRQGDYAKRRQLKLDPGFVRRIAIIAAAILAVTLLIQLTMIARYSFAADALERETVEAARDAIPGTVEITDPDAQLRARLNALGGGAGYGEIASATFTAVRETAGVELQALIFDVDGGLQVTAAAPGEAELVAFQQRMMASGLLVAPGAIRDGGGRQIAEYRVSAP